MSRFSKSTEVQSFLFEKQKWSVTAAKKWLLDHGKKSPKVETTPEYHRFRQAPPFQFEKGTFRTIPIGAKAKGIKAVIAVPRLKKNPESKRNPPNQKTSKPWLPATLVDLADPISIDLEDGRQLKFPRGGRWAMCSNKSGTEIWILSRRGAKQVRATDEQAEDLYEKFTGYEHDQGNAAPT